MTERIFGPMFTWLKFDFSDLTADAVKTEIGVFTPKKDLYIMGMDLWWEGGSLARMVVEWGVLGHRHPPRQAGQGLDQSQSADRIFLCSTFFFSRAAAAAADDGKLNCKKWPLV